MNENNFSNTNELLQETETTPQNSETLDLRTFLNKLRQDSITFSEFRPVALRIDKEIKKRYPDFDKKIIRGALRLHTASTRYLKSVQKNEHRFDFDGNPVAEITDEHKNYAQQTLKERFAKSAKKRKEKENIERQIQIEKEAEERKVKKLKQLITRFSK